MAAKRIDDKKAALDAENAARFKARLALQQVYVNLIEGTQGKLDKLNAPAKPIAPVMGFGGVPIQAGTPPDESANRQQYEARIEDLKAGQQRIMLAYEQGSLQQKDILARRGKEADEAAKKAAEDWMTKQEEALSIQKSAGRASTAYELEFWEQRVATAAAGGKAWENIHRKILTDIGNLTIQLMKQQDEETRRTQLEGIQERIKTAQAAAEEAGEGPALAKLRVLNLTESEPYQGSVIPEQVHKELPEAEIAARRESIARLKAFATQYVAEWKNAIEMTGKVVTPEAELDLLERLKAKYIGIRDIVAEINKLEVGPRKAIVQQDLRAADLHAAGAGDIATVGVQNQRGALQAAYEAQATHTIAQEIDYKKALSALETQLLNLKVNQAAKELQNALAAGDTKKAEEDKNKVLQAGIAVQARQAQAVRDLDKLIRENTIHWQVQTGLARDVESAASNMSAAFARAVVSGKGLGTVLRDALKGLEMSALDTVMKSILGAGVNAIKPLLGQITGGIGSALGGIFGKVLGGGKDAAQVANTTAVTALTAAVTANTVAIGGEVAASGAGAAGGLMGFLKGALSIFGFAEGGRPTPGAPSIIGEKGPELWIPDAPGTIIPNSILRSAPGGSSNYLSSHTNSSSMGDMHFHIYGANDPDRVMRQIAQRAKSAFPRFSPANS